MSHSDYIFCNPDHLGVKFHMMKSSGKLTIAMDHKDSTDSSYVILDHDGFMALVGSIVKDKPVNVEEQSSMFHDAKYKKSHVVIRGDSLDLYDASEVYTAISDSGKERKKMGVLRTRAFDRKVLVGLFEQMIKVMEFEAQFMPQSKSSEVKAYKKYQEKVNEAKGLLSLLASKV